MMNEIKYNLKLGYNDKLHLIICDIVLDMIHISDTGCHLEV
jgi:hypothetical protein